MTILVCQECEKTVDFMDDDKVSVLYVKCNCCHDEK